MGKRDQLARLAMETDRIVEIGGYVDPRSGVFVDLGESIQDAIRSTAVHDAPVEKPANATIDGDRAGTISVDNETTVAALLRLAGLPHGGTWCLLNFASPRNPGGGYQRGSDAQEESLARSSALAECLRSVPEFYAREYAARPVGTGNLVHSGNVPFFRDAYGNLLEAPIAASVISGVAVNQSAITQNDSLRRKISPKDIAGIMTGYVGNVLHLAAEKGERSLILGAWGTGVFGQSAEQVARAFATMLIDRDCRSLFDRIHFAVPASASDDATLIAFRKALT